MRVTFLLLPYRPVPIGGAMVLYECANRLSRRGHSVTLVHGYPMRSVFGFPGASSGAPPPVVVPDSHWFAIDSEVTTSYVSVLVPEVLPDADVLFNAAYVGEYPKAKGMQVLYVQGSGFVPWEEESACLREPGCKFCVSRWLCDVVRSAGVRAEDIVHVPNGVDHDIFSVERPVESRPRRVAMLYSDLWVKGGDIGIEAVARIRARLPDVEAIFFGVQSRPSAIPEWVEYRQLPSRRELATEVYNTSAVLMCPNRNEGFNLCGLEGMASACALVTTDVGGIRDYAEHEVTALVSPIEDVTALADNAVRLLQDDALRVRIARAGHARSLEFDWDGGATVVETELEKRLRERRPA